MNIALINLLAMFFLIISVFNDGFKWAVFFLSGIIALCTAAIIQELRK
jgi:hypothetical protein